MVLNLLWWVAFVPAIQFWIDLYNVIEINRQAGERVAITARTSRLPGLMSTVFIIWGLFAI